MTDKTCADFTPLVNQKFKVTVVEAEPEDDIEAVEAELVLVKVRETGNDMCEGFSLIFTGAADKVLPQRTYKMANATLGEEEIFIVPVAGTPEGEKVEGQAYQAIFNRLKPAAAAANPMPKAPEGQG